MIRINKFRGRSIETGEWVYGCLLNNLWVYSEQHPLHGQDVTEIIVGGEATDWETVEEELKITVDPATVGQFTGLLDSNKKEVYEGDILMDQYEDREQDDNYEWHRCTRKIYYPVVFQDGCFGWIGDITGDFYSFHQEPVHEAEIVGNIFENSELLKQTT